MGRRRGASVWHHSPAHSSSSSRHCGSDDDATRMKSLAQKRQATHSRFEQSYAGCEWHFVTSFVPKLLDGVCRDRALRDGVSRGSPSQWTVGASANDAVPMLTCFSDVIRLVYSIDHRTGSSSYRDVLWQNGVTVDISMRISDEASDITGYLLQVRSIICKSRSCSVNKSPCRRNDTKWLLCAVPDVIAKESSNTVA